MWAGLAAAGMLAAGATAHGEETSHPWVIVNAEKRCARVESIHPGFTVDGLLAREGCEREDLGLEAVAMIDCDARWKGKSFVLTETKEACEYFLRVLVERASANAAPE